MLTEFSNVTGINLALLVTAALAGLPSSSARAEGNPYSEIIVTRNVFALKDPPPPPPPAENTPAPPKITLVGIANVFGVRKAVLKPHAATGTAPKQAVLGQPPLGQEPPLVLMEGAMQDGITVVSIDESAGSVKVDNNGQSLTLSFEKDGLKVPSGAAVAVPGPAGQAGSPVQAGLVRPPGMPGGVTPPGSAGAAGAMGPAGGGGVATSGSQPGVIALPGGVGSIPGAADTASTHTPSQSAIPPRQIRTMSPEEYAVMYEVNRERSRSLVEAGKLPPMPPHPMFRDLNSGGLAPTAPQ